MSVGAEINARWTNSKINLFLDLIYEKNYVSRLVTQRQKNREIFQALQKEFAARGELYTWLNLRSKWKNLKVKYYGLKSQPERCRQYWTPFAKMDRLLAKYPKAAVKGSEGSGLQHDQSKSSPTAPEGHTMEDENCSDGPVAEIRELSEDIDQSGCSALSGENSIVTRLPDPVVKHVKIERNGLQEKEAKEIGFGPFIEEVKRCSILYDRFHVGYRNEALKRCVWSNLAAKFQMDSSDEAMELWNKLCRKFLRQSKLHSLDRTWPHFETMKFINQFENDLGSDEEPNESPISYSSGSSESPNHFFGNSDFPPSQSVTPPREIPLATDSLQPLEPPRQSNPTHDENILLTKTPPQTELEKTQVQKVLLEMECIQEKHHLEMQILELKKKLLEEELRKKTENPKSHENCEKE